jgi:hypothetical protein
MAAGCTCNTQGLNWLYYWGYFRKIACKIFFKPPAPNVTTHFPSTHFFSSSSLNPLFSLSLSLPVSLSPLLSLIIGSATPAPSPLKSTTSGHHLTPFSHRFPASSSETSLKLLDAYAIFLKVKTELSSQISL